MAEQQACDVTDYPPGWPPHSSEWIGHLSSTFREPWFRELIEFVQDERNSGEVFPPEDQIFRAFALTPLRSVKFVILGQDPYHRPGQAHGLSFSVPDDVPPPPSLKNIFKELQSDVGCPPPPSGDLSPWARRGGLLLNTVLTVQYGEAHSHRGQGWERFTDEAIRVVARQRQRISFLLWGRPAQKKRSLIESAGGDHQIIEAPHPSPLSAHRGFLGSRPFSRVNQFRRQHGLEEIDWSL